MAFPMDADWTFTDFNQPPRGNMLDIFSGETTQSVAAGVSPAVDGVHQGAFSGVSDSKSDGRPLRGHMNDMSLSTPYSRDKDDMDDDDDDGNNESSKMSKEQHRLSEKLRRQKTNEAVAELRQLTGNRCKRKLEVIINAAEQMRAQQKQLEAQTRTIEQLKDQVALLQAQLQQRNANLALASSASMPLSEQLTNGASASVVREMPRNPHPVVSDPHPTIPKTADRCVNENPLYHTVSRLISSVGYEPSRLFQMAFWNCGVSCFIATLDMRIIAFNNVFAGRSGFNETDLRNGLSCVSLTQANEIAENYEMMSALLSGKRQSIFIPHKVVVTRANKNMKPVRVTLTLIYDADNVPRFLMGFVSRIEDNQVTPSQPGLPPASQLPPSQ